MEVRFSLCNLTCIIPEFSEQKLSFVMSTNIWPQPHPFARNVQLNIILLTAKHFQHTFLNVIRLLCFSVDYH